MKLKYMKLALKFASEAYKMNEVPVGTVIVKDGKVISYAFNKKECNKSVLEHAELIAIRQAEKVLDNWRLDGCDLYVTLDPCPMCASAIKQARISNVFSALQNSDPFNTELINQIFSNNKNNPKVNFYTNLCPLESQKLLSSFFKMKR